MLMLSSNLSQVTGYPHQGFSWFFLVFPLSHKCWGTISIRLRLLPSKSFQFGSENYVVLNGRTIILPFDTIQFELLKVSQNESIKASIT